MDEAGNTKDDVKLQDGEIKDKITKLFIEEEKNTSESWSCSSAKCHINMMVDVVILTAMGKQVATEAKEAPKNEWTINNTCLSCWTSSHMQELGIVSPPAQVTMISVVKGWNMVLKHALGHLKSRSRAATRSQIHNLVKSGLWAALLVDAASCRLAHSES